MTEIKDEYINLAFPSIFGYDYDDEELLKLDDGGEVLVNYKFQKDKVTGQRRESDVLFLFTGQVGSNQSLYIKNIINEAFEKRGYDIVVVSWRGQSGTKLATPKLYNAFSIDDVREPIRKVMSKFNMDRNSKRKAYAIGCSMGAMILANALGVDQEDSPLEAAVCVQAAIKKWEGIDYFANSLGGIYNRAMGSYQWDYLKVNLDLLGPHFQKEYGIDLAQKLEDTEPSYGEYHQLITAPMNGYKDVQEYLRKAAPYDRIPTIKRPTLFMNAKNDAFMGDVVLDYDVFKDNENVVLATNEYAGHIGYHEWTFSME